MKNPHFLGNTLRWYPVDKRTYSANIFVSVVQIMHSTVTILDMNIDHRALSAYFEKLGFSAEIAAIYLALYIHGPQTISQLSRRSKVERTRIYRLIHELETSHLVETELRHKHRIFHATPINNLQITISKKEHELEQLQTELKALSRVLTQPTPSSTTAPVQFYQGLEGAKQMFWNQTKARTEMLSILHVPLQNKVEQSFFNRWSHTMNERGIPHRSIVNDGFLIKLKEWHGNNQHEKIEKWEGRIVSEEVFSIAHSTHIYDDVTAYYNWESEEMFGVAIRNLDIANTQRQFFEILWQQSKAIK
jgi:DNA-binding MarR family transcriptional regulator